MPARVAHAGQPASRRSRATPLGSLGSVIVSMRSIKLERSAVLKSICATDPRVWGQQRMVERPGEHPDAVAVQRTHVDVLDLAVLDVDAGPASVAGGLAEAQERRGAVAGGRGATDRRRSRPAGLGGPTHPPSPRSTSSVPALTADAVFWRRPAGSTQNRWFDAMRRSRRDWVSRDQPMNRSRGPHDSTGDAKPSNATHSPDESVAA